MGTKRTRHALVSYGRNSRVAEHELYTSNIVNQNIWSDPFEIEDTPPVRFNEPEASISIKIVTETMTIIARNSHMKIRGKSGISVAFRAIGEKGASLHPVA
ncbi:hypothetical protein HMPREF9374_0807 [Desmospora sp. 8437]|nr:hypothetical protein HMPREF9374_0807 [Desmospora sp. 8437]